MLSALSISLFGRSARAAFSAEGVGADYDTIFVEKI